MTLLTTRDGVVHGMDGMCPRDHEAYRIGDPGDPAAMVVITKCGQRIDEDDFEWVGQIQRVFTYTQTEAVISMHLTCTGCDSMLTLEALKGDDVERTYWCSECMEYHGPGVHP